jgi:hypothetical protein
MDHSRPTQEDPRMTESGKLTDKAADLAAQAAAVAVPLARQAKERAGVLAGQAVAAAGPIASQARHTADEFAAKAGPVAAHGVGALGENIDKLTGGKYSGKISTITAKIEKQLDPAKPAE